MEYVVKGPYRVQIGEKVYEVGEHLTIDDAATAESLKEYIVPTQAAQNGPQAPVSAPQVQTPSPEPNAAPAASQGPQTTPDALAQAEAALKAAEQAIAQAEHKEG
jgi:hypothetical protein